MTQLPRIHLFTFAVIASVMFSVTHAKDISSVALLTTLASTSQLKAVDNGIHLDLHTHVDRQTLSSLLHSAQQDRPLTNERSLRRALESFKKRENKLPDGELGQYVPI